MEEVGCNEPSLAGGDPGQLGIHALSKAGRNILLLMENTGQCRRYRE